MGAEPPMRIVIFRSRPRQSGERPPGPYTQEFRSRFADRVIGNLRNEEGFCSACGPDCTACRRRYDRRFGPDIVGVMELPASLPYLLEDPAALVPEDVPAHDVLLAINIHEQVLCELLRRCGRWGTRAAVAPLEAGDWVGGSACAEAERIGQAAGVAVAFPKPFCAFDPPDDGVLAEVRRRLHIGRPEVKLTVADGRIERAHVEVSAACGATYYVARWLEGRRIDDDLKYEVIAKRMHSYPCTASMKWDDELGDTPLHVANQAHYRILEALAPAARTGEAEASEMVMSPLGRMLPKPVAARENIRNIERAKEAILEALAGGEELSLADLRRRRRISPAAATSALLILRQEGRVRTEGEWIVKS